MSVKLLHYTPLWVVDKAIGKCWNKPTPLEKELRFDGIERFIPGCNVKRIDRVANKNKHGSTIEHLYYNFEINGISRACLQELARHRIASLSVKSTRYTLKELKNEKPFISPCLVRSKEYIRANKYVVLPDNLQIIDYIIQNLENLRLSIQNGISNDIAKYCLPEAYKTDLIWSVNARSLQNFLKLRSSKQALWEIRELANEIYGAIPKDHKFLFEECINGAI